MPDLREEIYNLCTDLFPICRSITGSGVRQTLKILQHYLPDIKIYEVPSGTQAYDWIVPQEWTISDAYILDHPARKLWIFTPPIFQFLDILPQSIQPYHLINYRNISIPYPTNQMLYRM